MSCQVCLERAYLNTPMRHCWCHFSHCSTKNWFFSNTHQRWCKKLRKSGLFKLSCSCKPKTTNREHLETKMRCVWLLSLTLSPRSRLWLIRYLVSRAWKSLHRGCRDVKIAMSTDSRRSAITFSSQWWRTNMSSLSKRSLSLTMLRWNCRLPMTSRTLCKVSKLVQHTKEPIPPTLDQPLVKPIIAWLTAREKLRSSSSPRHHLTRQSSSGRAT